MGCSTGVWLLPRFVILSAAKNPRGFTQRFLVFEYLLGFFAALRMTRFGDFKSFEGAA
jgi:hypothetical protein